MIPRRFGRHAGWGIADQTASSFVNFALGVFVARQTTTEAFGAFSLAFLSYLLCMNLGRAIVAKPMLIRYSDGSAFRWRDGVGRGMVAAAAFGVVAGAVCVVIGVACLVVGVSGGGELGTALIGMGISMPALLIQDAWRFAFFAARRGRDAFLNDALRALLLVPIFAALLLLEVSSVMALILGWGLSAAASAVAGLFQARVVFAQGAVRLWLREHWDLVPRFAGESFVNVGSIQLTYALIGVIGGLASVGAIRAGDLILGPFNILSMGVFLVVLPEATRLLATSSAALIRGCALLSAGLAGSALVFGGICLLLPESVGSIFLGTSWEPARSVLVPLTLSLMSVVAGAAATTGLRALEAAGRILRAAIAASVALIGLATAGVVLGGSVGAAWGMAAGSFLGAVWWWWELLGAVRSSTRPGTIA